MNSVLQVGAEARVDLLRPSPASRSCRCRSPRRARRRSTTSRICSASTPFSPSRSWRMTTSNVRPLSRSASVSPTQRMGLRRSRSAAFTLRLISSSLSPMTWRRSLWPTMTIVPPASRIEVARDLAGEGAVGLGPAVLRADLDRVVAERLGDRREARERGEDRRSRGPAGRRCRPSAPRRDGARPGGRGSSSSCRR